MFTYFQMQGGALKMAYDWSGNDIKQRHYDRVIVAALLTLVSIAVTAPFMLHFETDMTAKAQAENRAPIIIEEARTIRLARS